MCFSPNFGSVLQFRYQPHIANGGRENVAFARQHLRRQSHCFGEVAGYFGERGEEKITKTMATQFAIATEAMTKQTR